MAHTFKIGGICAGKSIRIVIELICGTKYCRISNKFCYKSPTKCPNSNANTENPISAAFHDFGLKIDLTDLAKSPDKSIYGC